MTHRECVAYLRFESRGLREQVHGLSQELDALRAAPFTIERYALYSRHLRAYRGLVANHALAVRWLVLDVADHVESFRERMRRA